jgi:hypothetical protein
VPTAKPEPTAEPAPTAAPKPTSAPAPTATPQPAAELFYFDQGALYARPASGSAHRIADIDGDVFDVALSGDALLVLRPAGLERIDLASGAASPAVKFDTPAGIGSRMLVGRDQLVYYSAWFEDPNAVFGKSQVGYYDPKSGEFKRPLTVDGRAAPLGLNPAGDGLYLLPLGGDPSFGQIQVIDIASGKVRAELPVTGETMPAVSPDGRMLIVPARDFSSSDPNAEPASLLYLYDLTAKQVQPQVIAPPKGPSAAITPFWAPDGSAFYFGLGSGNIYELKDSYGLWRYTLATGAAEPVGNVDVRSSWFNQVSPSGAVLVRRTTANQSQLVDLSSGAATPLALDPSAIVAGWR